MNKLPALEETAMQERAGAASGGASAGESLLRQLASRGVDWFFADSGTDFAPMVEALTRALRVVREEKRQALLNVMCC